MKKVTEGKKGMVIYTINFFDRCEREKYIL